MTILTKSPAQCLRMYACLLTALLCLNMPVSCCSWLSMLCSSICLALPCLSSICIRQKLAALLLQTLSTSSLSASVCPSCVSNQAQASNPTRKTASSTPRILQFFTGLLKRNIPMCADVPFHGNKFKRILILGCLKTSEMLIYSWTFWWIIYTCHSYEMYPIDYTQWPHCNTVIKVEIRNFTHF